MDDAFISLIAFVCFVGDVARVALDFLLTSDVGIIREHSLREARIDKQSHTGFYGLNLARHGLALSR